MNVFRIKCSVNHTYIHPFTSNAHMTPVLVPVVAGGRFSLFCLLVMTPGPGFLHRSMGQGSQYKTNCVLEVDI